MSEGSSGAGPARPAGDDDDDPSRTVWDRNPLGRPDPAGPSYRPPADGASPYAQTYVQPPEAPSPYAPTYVQRPEAPSPYAPTYVQRPEAPSPYAPTYVQPPEAPSPYAPTYVQPPEALSPYAQTYVQPRQPPPDPGGQYAPTHVTARDEAPWGVAGRAANGPPNAAASPYAPTHAQRQTPPDPGAAYAPTFIPLPDGETANPPSDVVRYGPGVPVSQAGVTAEQVWRTGGLPEPVRRPGRWRRMAGGALTAILLVAAAVVLFLRFHHAPFQVTGVAITQQTKTTCGVDLTGRINTNGSAGMVSYQWVFRPQVQAPQPLNQSVTAGQHATYVSVAVEGEGHGTTSQTVTLQVLGPGTGTDTRHVSVSC